MPEVTFEEAEFPVVTATKRANPHAEMVKKMVESGGARKVVLPNKTDEDKRNITSLISSVQAAGREVGVTVNKEIQELSGKDSGKVAIFFKTRTAIKRSALARGEK